MGKKSKAFLEIALAVVQFQFTIAQLSFIIQGLKSTTESLFKLKDLKEEYFALIVLALFSPLAWVRKIEAFKQGFIFAFAMIVVTLVTISAFCISMNINHAKEINQQIAKNETLGQEVHVQRDHFTEKGLVPINHDSYWNTIGFSFFMFEGIGGVMPVMSATKDREAFPTILAITLGVLTTIYICFAELCYYTFGDKLDKPIIMEMMPADNPIIQIIKIAFIINLVFSYPLCIFITNLIAESYTFKKCKKATTCRKWLKNLQRSVVLLAGILCALYLKDTLDKVLSLSGCVLGTTVCLTMPALSHYFLLARTRKEKACDLFLFICAQLLLVVCTI